MLLVDHPWNYLLILFIHVHVLPLVLHRSAIAMFLTIEDMEDNYNKLQGMQWNGDDIRVDYVAENSVLAGGWEGRHELYWGGGGGGVESLLQN